MLLQRLASHLPLSTRQMLRIARYRIDFARGRFLSDEPEYQRLAELVHPADWVLDIGANADLVGAQGRVIAFEPILETVGILAAMSRRASHRNITILNVAVSDCAGLPHFQVPSSPDSLPDYSQSRVTNGDGAAVLAMALDDLAFPHPPRHPPRVLPKAPGSPNFVFFPPASLGPQSSRRVHA
jgi:FkbM family methyltransferase